MGRREAARLPDRGSADQRGQGHDSPALEVELAKHPSMNAGYMISGEILVTAEDGQTCVGKAGEGLIETVNTWHYGRNDSDLPAEIVVIY